MENKTKEQLGNEYCKENWNNDSNYFAFIAGYDSRQPEIDDLKEEVKHLLILVENKNALISTLENEKKQDKYSKSIFRY